MFELEKLAKEEGWQDYRLKEWRGDIRKFVPSKSTHIGSLIFGKDEWTVYFVSSTGDIVKNPCKIEVWETSNYAGDEPFHLPGESIGEALLRYPDTRFVVLFHREILDRDGDYYHSEEAYVVDLSQEVKRHGKV